MKVLQPTIMPPDRDVFKFIGIRELSRRTGLDIGYLSRVKNNKIAVSPTRYIELWAATNLYMETK